MSLYKYSTTIDTMSVNSLKKPSVLTRQTVKPVYIHTYRVRVGEVVSSILVFLWYSTYHPEWGESIRSTNSFCMRVISICIHSAVRHVIHNSQTFHTVWRWPQDIHIIQASDHLQSRLSENTDWVSLQIQDNMVGLSFACNSDKWIVKLKVWLLFCRTQKGLPRSAIKDWIKALSSI